MKKIIKKWLDIDDIEIKLSIIDSSISTGIKNEVNIFDINIELSKLRTEVSLLRATNEHMQKLVQDMKLNDMEAKSQVRIIMDEPEILVPKRPKKK